MAYKGAEKKERCLESTEEIMCIQPSNVEKFFCDASQCDEHCCQKWKITIDKDTYFRYLRIKDKLIRDRIISSIQKNKGKNVQDGEFATIKLNKQMRCPLQDDDLRCFIQKNLGEPYLSYTCNMYPRRIHQLNGYFWQSIDVSCPLAAKAVLLDREPLHLEHVPLKKKFLLKYVPDVKLHGLATILPVFQIFILSLIQNQRYCFRTRLAILGLFMEEASEVERSGDLEACRQLIQKFEALLETDEFQELIGSISSNRTKRVRYGLACMEIITCYVSIEDREKNFFSAFEQGLGLEGEMPILKLLARYGTARQDVYMPFMKEHSYILEKFFCNLIFQQSFPFLKNKTLKMNFLCLLAIFETLDLFLTGLSAHYKEELKAKHVIGAMQAIYRVVFHTTSVSVLDAFLEKGDPDIMSMLPLLQEESPYMG